MLKLDDGMFYIAGGHIFTGTYREFEGAEEKNSTKASQTYLGEIRKLSFKRGTGGQLSVSLVERYPNPEFARRDLNAVFTILPDGHSLGAAIYGGVFTKDQLSFTQADLLEREPSAASGRRLRAEDERLRLRDVLIVRPRFPRHVHHLLRRH